MKLSIVVGMLGQHEMTSVAINQILENIIDPETQVIVIDNGGDWDNIPSDRRLIVHRPDRNLGVYPVFDYAFKLPFITGDVVAFFHSDVMIAEKGFDARVLQQFERDHALGLVGFVGSTEIDFHGGRGGGTTSNFQGNTYHYPNLSEWPACTDKVCLEREGGSAHNHPPVTAMQWTGSPAEAHGKRNAGFVNAAVVDGCVMIIRRTAWNLIGFREDFPPHHFYDRLISTQMLEAHYKVGVLGVAFDHISGQTVSKEERYGNMARDWCGAHSIGQKSADEPWDQVVYLAAERAWLQEYRDRKHIVPITV